MLLEEAQLIHLCDSPSAPSIELRRRAKAVYRQVIHQPHNPAMILACTLSPGAPQGSVAAKEPALAALPAAVPAPVLAGLEEAEAKRLLRRDR